MRQKTLLLIGCGEMGGNLLKGWVTASSSFSFHVITPHQTSVTKIAPHIPWFPTPEAYQAAGLCPDMMLFAVRPQLFQQIAPAYRTLIEKHNPIVGSIIAGLATKALQETLPEIHTCFRAMPNLPVATHEGVVGLMGQHLSDSNRTLIETLFKALGLVVWIKDESCFNDFTALSGCGPGIVYAFFSALLEAAKTLNTGIEDAEAVVKQLLQGSAAYVASHEQPFETLAAQVAVPGGMTEQAIHTLQHNHALTTLLSGTLAAASHHGEKLGKK